MRCFQSTSCRAVGNSPKRRRYAVSSYPKRCSRLSAALRDWQICELPQEYYMMQNASGDDICRILAAFGIDNTDRIYTKGGLAALKSGVKAF